MCTFALNFFAFGSAASFPFRYIANLAVVLVPIISKRIKAIYMEITDIVYFLINDINVLHIEWDKAKMWKFFKLIKTSNVEDM